MGCIGKAAVVPRRMTMFIYYVKNAFATTDKSLYMASAASTISLQILLTHFAMHCQLTDFTYAHAFFASVSDVVEDFCFLHLSLFSPLSHVLGFIGHAPSNAW